MLCNSCPNPQISCIYNFISKLLFCTVNHHVYFSFNYCFPFAHCSLVPRPYLELWHHEVSEVHVVKSWHNARESLGLGWRNISAERCYIENLTCTYMYEAMFQVSSLLLHSVYMQIFRFLLVHLHLKIKALINSGLCFCFCFTSFLSETSVFIVNRFPLIVWWHSLVTYGHEWNLNLWNIPLTTTVAPLCMLFISHATHVLYSSIAHVQAPW